MQAWEYKVAYVDFRGRVSIEGEEIILERGERRSEFVRRVLNQLGKDGWELGGVHPLWPAETSYMVFKREAIPGAATSSEAQAGEVSEESGEAQAGAQDTVRID